jgi:hypothetical protein
VTYQPPTAPEPQNQPPYPEQPEAPVTGQPQAPYLGQPQPPYPGQPLVGEPLGAPVAPPRKGGNTMLLVLSGVVALFVLCCGGGATGVYLMRDQFADSLARPSPSPTRASPRPIEPFPSDLPSLPAAPTQETEDLKPGQTLVVTSDEGDEVEVTVSAPRNRKDCGAYSKPKSGAYLIVDVTVQVTKGRGTISPYDFTFLLPDSTTTDAAGGRVTDCGKDLDYGNNMRAGTKRSGQLVFDVKPAKGQIVYKTRSREIAGSWKIG